MAASRQLAAIVFTDIVGYTALMGEDEEKAIQLLHKNRELQKPLIEKYNGTWIKEIGDGVLASFPTVTDAVLCANEIQNACDNIDDLKLRIGIHLGEVVFEDHDVFGEGVNIASRLQVLAPIGGTWISEAVYKNVSNKKEIITRFVREEILRNVKEPVKIYELVNGFTGNDKKVADTTEAKTIAGLSSVKGNDPNQENLFKSPSSRPASHQLAVVMFTDIMGYTAMMQQDETFALNKLNRFRNQLRARVGEFRGEIIQYYGDGCLIIFTSSADAVNCARILQQDFREAPQVPVRIGIHLGDILVNDGNIFGDCVNVTSRIESIGVPGSVLLSDAIKKQIQNKQGFELTSLGHFEFKNVAEPMEIFALTNDGFPVPGLEGNGKLKEQKKVKTIAVLPFVNMSNDADQEYFSDGIAEEIINSLTHLNELKVAGRTSSFQFKGKSVDLREIGEKLGVHNVLEGSVRKQGNHLRITAQLINLDDGYHLWSEKYDRDIDDLFAIQDDIAIAITEKLKLTLLEKDRVQILKSPTRNKEAYDLYLKARFYSARRGSSLITSLGYFQKAIELDPDFALAYAGYADANITVATHCFALSKDPMTRARQFSEKAIQLQPSLPEPYCCLGYYYSNYEWNWEEAKKNFLHAIELNPEYAQGHFRYSWNYLACVEGKFEEADKQGAIAIQLEPLSALCYAHYSLTLHFGGKFTEAIAACKTGIDLDPNSFLCHFSAGGVYTSLGQYDEAISAYETALALSNRHHFALSPLILTLCVKGDFGKATQLMDELKEKSLKGYVAPTLLAFATAYLDDLHKAFDLLEKAYQDRDPTLLMLKYHPLIPPPLKGDPRYYQMLDKIGFP